MILRDWLLFVHVLGAFMTVSALVALWAIVFATRSSASSLSFSDAMRIGRIAGPLISAGMTIALVFGIWLAIDIDSYSIGDGWILAALGLWIVAVVAGVRSGKLFSAGNANKRNEAIGLQAVNTAAVLIILILMIWKPGA